MRQSPRMIRIDAAPWSLAVKVASTLASAVLIAVALSLAGGLSHASRVPVGGALHDLLFVLPPLVLAIALLFVVRSYEVDGGELRVQRLLWTTTVPLDGIERAWHDPKAMSRSLRLFGNGGLFSITGWFRNRALGRYRAFVTNPHAAVVLRTRSRVLVLSPDDPRRFLEDVRRRFPAAIIGAPPSA